MKSPALIPFRKLISTLALVVTAIFVFDVTRTLLFDTQTLTYTWQQLALLVGLITMTCAWVGLAVGVGRAIQHHLRPQVSLATLIGAANLILSGLYVICPTAYFLLNHVFANRSPTYITFAVGLSAILALGITRVPPVDRGARWWLSICQQYPFRIGVSLLSVSVVLLLRMTSVLSVYPSVIWSIQTILLMVVVGLTWFIIEAHSNHNDDRALCFLMCLYIGCSLGVLNQKDLDYRRFLSAEQSSPTARHSLTFLRWLNDRDGDGFAAVFGGGDCDDTEFSIHPHAREIPGNGIDDNCVGGDAQHVTAIPTKYSSGPDAPRTTVYPSIVLIIVDTLRADRVQYSGRGRNTAPHLAKWARKSVRFSKAYAQAPHTPRSIPSLLTGKYPSQIKWVNSFENYPVPHRTETFLAEEFKEAGYETTTVNSHWYFARVPSVLRGFERNHLLMKTFRDSTDAEVTTDLSLKELDRLAHGDAPFFMMVHYIDPHEPYRVKTKKTRVWQSPS